MAIDHRHSRTKALLGVTDLRSIRDSTKSVFGIADAAVKIHPGYKAPAAYHDLAVAKLDRVIPNELAEVQCMLIFDIFQY